MKKLITLLVLIALGIPSPIYAERMYTTGFEWGTITTNVDFTVIDAGFNIGTTTRSGSSSIVFDPATSQQNLSFNYTVATSSIQYARVYFRFSTFPSTDTTIMVFRTSGGTAICLIDFDAANLTLELHKGDTAQVGSDSATLSLNTWYQVELKCQDDGTTNGLPLEAQLDGTSFASGTNVVTGSITSMQIGTHIDIPTMYMYIDDVAINGAGGSVQNSWPGTGKIVHILPSAAGDNAPTLGTFNLIDELPPDNATSFIDLDAATTIADFNASSTSQVGINSSDTISLVEIRVRIREESAAATLYQLRIKSASGGTLATTTSTDVGGTTWQTNPVSSTAFRKKLVSYIDPTTGIAWTPTGTNSIDNMQIGVASLSANDIDVSTLVAVVEYVDGITSQNVTSSPMCLINDGLFILNGRLIIP